MSESRAVRYILYGTSAVLLSEIIWHGVLWLRDVIVSRRTSSSSSPSDSCSNDREVSEVIWTNELTQSCSAQHGKNGVVVMNGGGGGGVDGGNGNGSDTNGIKRQVSYIVQLPKPTSAVKCKNRYCAANNVGRLIELIDKAKYTIDLAMYTFTSHELSLAFGRALKRGVDIRIISDKEMVYSSGSQIIGLTKAGIPVRCPATTMLMHHKFCILDGPLRALTVLTKTGKKYDKKQVLGIVMSGSLNWTMQGFGGNWENIVITSNKTIVNQFEKEYERMWIAFDHKLSPAKAAK